MWVYLNIPFGWKGSPKIFCMFSSALSAYFQILWHNFVYIDDFLFVLGNKLMALDLQIAAINFILKVSMAAGWKISGKTDFIPSVERVFLGSAVNSVLHCV